MSRAIPGALLSGRYRVDRLLGEGAAGTVWLVRDTREKGLVWALKELDFSGLPSSERDEQRKLFFREASMLMQLRHECLPRVVDRFSEGGREYLVMERVEGPTLDSVLKSHEGPIPEHEAAAWGVEICRVLEYLHGLEPPVIYRDLKPANVMIGVRGPIKLVDFGIARSMNPTRPGDTTAYGTPGYAPPEQYMGRACPESDIYALGATLYQLVTRWSPQEFTFRFAPAREHNPELSAAIESLLGWMLQQKPEERPGARRVREALERIAAQPRPWWSRALGRARHWLGRRGGRKG
ncbi:MAG: serine/threonine protein kinase [Armatimonadetes bacterium]|nr:serine/threonine protein kinase [Armatimonadota bacterium]